MIHEHTHTERERTFALFFIRLRAVSIVSSEWIFDRRKKWCLDFSGFAWRRTLRWALDIELDTCQSASSFLVEIDILTIDSANNIDQNIRFRIGELNPNVRGLIEVLTIVFPPRRKPIKSCHSAKQKFERTYMETSCSPTNHIVYRHHFQRCRWCFRCCPHQRDTRKTHERVRSRMNESDLLLRNN